MNMSFDVVSFAISLAINMLLIGSLVSVGIAAGFWLIRNIAPRVRYVILLVAFMIAIIVPLFTTLSGDSTQIALIEDPVQANQEIAAQTNSFAV